MRDRPHSTPEGKPEYGQKIEQADEGPLQWLPPVIESAYSRLAPREQELPEQEIMDAESLAATRRVSQPGDEYPLRATPFVSQLQPGRGGEILAAITHDF